MRRRGEWADEQRGLRTQKRPLGAPEGALVGVHDTAPLLLGGDTIGPLRGGAVIGMGRAVRFDRRKASRRAVAWRM
jgi:hypothetical protein